jgi:hypothetical protein
LFVFTFSRKFSSILTFYSYVFATGNFLPEVFQEAQ